MRRKTICLPDELAAAVKAEAARRGQSVSQFVREAIAARYAGAVETHDTETRVAASRTERG